MQLINKFVLSNAVQHYKNTEAASIESLINALGPSIYFPGDRPAGPQATIYPVPPISNTYAGTVSFEQDAPWGKALSMGTSGLVYLEGIGLSGSNPESTTYMVLVHTATPVGTAIQVLTRIGDSSDTLAAHGISKHNNQRFTTDKYTPSDAELVAASVIPASDTTYFIVVTEYQGGSPGGWRKIYINGVEVAADGGESHGSVPRYFMVGNLLSGVYPWKGLIGHVAMWDGTALTSTQISELWDSIAATLT